MQEVKELYFKEEGENVPEVVYKTEFIGACSLTVTAGTNGPQGGDSGHGCWTYIKLEPDCGFDMDVRVVTASDEDPIPAKVIIKTGGDWELHQMIQALKFITQVLEDK